MHYVFVICFDIIIYNIKTIYILSFIIFLIDRIEDTPTHQSKPEHTEKTPIESLCQRSSWRINHLHDRGKDKHDFFSG